MTEVLQRRIVRAAGASMAFAWLALSLVAAEPGRDTLILTSTNNPASNQVVVFRLAGSATLSLQGMVPSGGAGGASTNAGAVQFANGFGAVVNYGSANVGQLVRFGNLISIAGTVKLAPGCVQPVSVALTANRMFVVGSNCAESHAWPWANAAPAVVRLSDPSAAQIAVGQTWAAVTLTSGSLVHLPLNASGGLEGSSSIVALPADANSVPLGEAFWGDILGFDPAHSPDSFALVNSSGEVFPVTGPQPPYPANAPCWLARGPGNIWYSGNSPGQAISIFFSDGQGGVFYKSVPLPGSPTDITVSPDLTLLATIYTAADGSGARVAVFSIDSFGDLTPLATSAPIGVAAFNGVAISE